MDDSYRDTDLRGGGDVTIPDLDDVESIRAVLKEGVDPDAVASRLATALSDADEHRRATVSEVVGALGSLVADETEPTDVAATAARTLATLSGTHSRVLEPVVPDLLAGLKRDETRLNEDAAIALATVVPRSSDDVLQEIPMELSPLLNAHALSKSEAGVVLAERIAHRRPTALYPIVPDLFTVIEQQHELTEDESLSELPIEIRHQIQEDNGYTWVRVAYLRLLAARALIAWVAAEPETAVEYEEELIEALDDEPDGRIRSVLCVGVTLILEAGGIDAQQAIPVLAQVLDDTVDASNRGPVVRSLALLAAEGAEAHVASSLIDMDPVIAELDVEDPQRRANAATLVSSVAKIKRKEVATAVDTLVDLLDDEHAFVRGPTALALGPIAGEDARSALKRTAEEDDDASVRQAASAALDDQRVG